ncbi:M23 family metallopeptidase [Phytoactinopolyspora alkaliphila]|uniref:M23 family metallopeptidase n=1 Tax=Phytoactinopolyspora alkaliphila TaxID=1783498 RepID=A0A6N9YSC3_9ACTN|nr:M23 family metallopeptidase [Phytoactinopolyspora alkaliphila]NED97931.1 M23 family metallopeptidase [Phytoactinopolyspora alkaliphila]
MFLFTAALGASVVLGDDLDDEEPDGDIWGEHCAATGTAPGLDDEQSRVARIIIAEGQKAGVPRRGLIVALVTAAVESGVRNLDYGDRDSLGVFQQRPSMGWGTPGQIMDVSYAARAFYGGPGGPNSLGAASEPPGLLDIAEWHRIPVGDAAQAVQRSAYPERYGRWEQRARAWLADLTEGHSCSAVLPIGKGAYRITDRYGYREHPITGEWKLHDGLDFAAPSGTPVRAIAAGTVTYTGYRVWSGPNTVEITHADGHASVYGHMSTSTVGRGETVHPGQKIGTVGHEGLSTGPHLHLTITANGSPIDPESWFQTESLEP